MSSLYFVFSFFEFLKLEYLFIIFFLCVENIELL